MADFPPGYRLFESVVARLGDVRPASNGLTFQCLLPERHKHGDRHPSCRCWIGAAGELRAKCLGCGAPWRDIVRAVGLPAREWFPNKHQDRRPVTPPPVPKLVAEYAYRDAAGVVYAKKRKFSPGFHGRAKDFAWSRPVPEEVRWLCGIGDAAGEAVADGPGCLEEGWFLPVPWGDGSWHFRQTKDTANPKAVLLPACPAGLYGLDRLHAPGAAGRGVFVCEGEKDADTLHRLGFIAVSGPNGSSAWSPAHAEALAGRAVVVVPDHDAPGEAHARAVAGSLVWAGVGELRVMRPGHGGYDPQPGGDVTDWLRALCDLDRDRAAARRAVLAAAKAAARFSCAAAGV